MSHSNQSERMTPQLLPLALTIMLSHSAEAGAQPSTVTATTHSDPVMTALFLAMPGDASGRPALLETLSMTDAAAIEQGRPARAKHSQEYGGLVVRSLGDGEGWFQQLKRYDGPAGQTILLFIESTWGMCGTQSKVTVWAVSGGLFTDVTRTHWPLLSWQDFNDGTPITEQAGQLPVYAVHLTRDEQRLHVSLDGCQLAHDELLFTPATPKWVRSERVVEWDGGHFRLSTNRPPSQ